ncbi:hypothetical protein LP419_02450 [Massilia sp. H-1]|nr:hypothetical protein LP419_02450 [Massilia sp. H-1]
MLVDSLSSPISGNRRCMKWRLKHARPAPGRLVLPDAGARQWLHLRLRRPVRA